ncbi:amine oxidoreductase [Roseobacter denitrificans]|uniref:Amine oxidase domain-containing protein n=2 Tax=Roseobacter denitrificans TaxID=2434 RepID=Q167L4_ROSDO|nr:conserved hypothetical protein [Roseobacter denitrificans OCh 114]AVL54675.1 amine oxidoreductase [Roseobacter denitrificans]
MTGRARIAIIGAGISGLRLAQLLSSKADVTVFEKSRGTGGRMSTRRADVFQFDHGAQYFTARGDDFQRFLAAHIEQGTVAMWCPRLACFGGQPPQWTAPRYVGVPGMNALCKAMAGDVEVRHETRVLELERKDGRWHIGTADGEGFGPFDWVFSSAPAEQSAALLPACFSGSFALGQARMLGCYSLMLGFDAAPDLAWDAAAVLNSPLAWLAVNSTKPGRSAGFSVLCQSSNDWAEAHLEADADHVRSTLAQVVREVTGLDVDAAQYVSLHKWRFAKVDRPTQRPFLLDADNKLGAFGDWCGAGRVEAGFDSATELARALII